MLEKVCMGRYNIHLISEGVPCPKEKYNWWSA